MDYTARKRILSATLTPDILRECSAADLKRIRAAVLEQLNKRYKWTRTPKYGGLNRGFTDEEIEAFFRACTNHKAAVMFRLQQYLGLRIGEVVRLKTKDVDLKNRHLYLHTEKARQPDCLFLHDLALRTIQNALDYADDEWVFPGARGGHASEHWLGNQFRYAMQRLAINRTYCLSDPCGPDLRQRSCNRLTPHSFRHYFIRRCWSVANGDSMLVMRLARHRSFKSTQTYLQVQQTDMDATMVSAFGSVRVLVAERG